LNWLPLFPHHLQTNDPATETVPYSQGVQGSPCPIEEEYVFTGQGVQLVEPRDGAKVPIGQGVHTVAPRAEE